LIWLVETAVAVKPAGAEGGVVSGGGLEEVEPQPETARAKDRKKKRTKVNSGVRWRSSGYTWVPSD